MRQKRVDKLREIFLKKNISAFLVSNFYNVLYLIGFQTLTSDEREAWALITTKNSYLFTDRRYINDPSQIKDHQLRLITAEKGLLKHLQEIRAEENIKTIGIEGDDLKLSEYQKFKEKLAGISLVSTEKLLVKQREIKEPDEIDRIRTACRVADQCLKEIVGAIKIGVTEKKIAFLIEFWLKEKNYDLSFYPIVAINKNSAIPHYDTRGGNDEKVKKNSLILIDFGAKFKNYHSDMTRMIFVGSPSTEMSHVYVSLLNAQEKTIKQLTSDNNPVSVDQFCRQLLAANSLPNYPHSTGHGVGLQIHESPKISFTSKDVLLPNQIVTIEPGIYLENKWGMRIEDTILIKKNKQIEVLTQFSKQLLII